MTAPARVQLRRTAGWRKPDGVVVVSRPTRWGNPALALDVIGQRRVVDMRAVYATLVDTFAALVDADGRLDLPGWPRADGTRGPVTFIYPTRAEIRAALVGRSLACWCPLDMPCHADVLLTVANTCDDHPTTDQTGDHHR